MKRLLSSAWFLPDEHTWQSGQPYHSQCAGLEQSLTSVIHEGIYTSGRINGVRFYKHNFINVDVPFEK